MENDQQPLILMADDDADDREMAERALEGTSLQGRLRFVENGVELIEYLSTCSSTGEAGRPSSPAFILLDLNMPRMNGYEVLEVLKGDEHLRRIPVVVLTTSSAEEDVARSYDLGVNAFVTKPVRFEDLRRILGRIGEFWLEIAESPPL
jgi:CheY-like chemotaxis protein